MSSSVTTSMSPSNSVDASTLQRELDATTAALSALQNRLADLSAHGRSVKGIKQCIQPVSVELAQRISRTVADAEKEVAETHDVTR
jgi:hypothetical protein